MYTTYPKLYIRTKKNVPFSTETYPLAFATPYEDNVAGKKRQDTVDDWASPSRYDYTTRQYVKPDFVEANILDNIPAHRQIIKFLIFVILVVLLFKYRQLI
jgi:hypothetical protein